MRQIRDYLLLLHSADIVWKCQNFFGIEKIDSYLSVNDGPILTNGYLHNNSANGSTKNCLTKENERFRISLQFFYFLFKFGSFLGQEEFYVIFFPFWFWHFDAPTGRKMMFIWMICMHIGQVAKDYLRWPRPKSPPVVQLENMFLSEYGMPSTHATVAASIPFCVMFFQKQYCEMSFTLCALFVSTWLPLVCLSRIYMGVHSFLEIFAGLAISVIVTAILVPNVNVLDFYFTRDVFGPVVLTLLTFLSSFLYPNTCNTFTRSWSDAIAVLASTTGILCGSWMELNICGHITPPFCIFKISINFTGLLYVLLKTVSGIIVILTAKVIARHSYDFCMKTFFHITKDNLPDDRKLLFEVPRKFLAYFAVGFNVFLTPYVMRSLKNV